MITISGDSMTPFYREGDCVIVDRDALHVRKGDWVVVQTSHGETAAKEIS
jgi:phage repressor protein C with HTH and peptisase S24 domain